MDSPAGFWLLIYAISFSVLALFTIAVLIAKLRGGKRLTWELNSQYIDISEFSNRNIPLRVMYKGAEPRWLWASYLSLRNTGSSVLSSDDSPERRQFIVGAPGCRYIGFNKLISSKARVNLSPLFKGEDVYCKVEFDKLGPGDEILASLLFIADEKHRVEVDGEMFGADSRLVSGYVQRMQAWRSLWWLIISMVILGIMGGYLFWLQSVTNQDSIMYQLQILSVAYFLALITAAVLLRPIRYWEQVPDKFNEVNGKSVKTVLDRLKFLFGWNQPE